MTFVSLSMGQGGSIPLLGILGNVSEKPRVYPRLVKIYGWMKRS